MIIVKNRELLIPDEERYIGTNYDTSSENRQFRVSRFAQNGVDLSALTFRLDLKYENASVDTLILEKETTDDYLVLTWEITKQQVQAPGTLWIQIRAIDSEATVRWSSYLGAMYVDRHLYTPKAYTGDLTEIEQIEQDHQYMLSVVNDLKANLDYAHDAEAWAQGTRNGSAVPSSDKTYQKNSKYYSEQANASKNAAANSATAAAGSATQAAATVADTNTRFNNAVAAVTVDTEVQDARVGADGTQYTVLKNRLDAENSLLKSHLMISDTEVFGGAGEGFPLEFENGTYLHTAVNQELQKYTGGGYSLTRKVVKSTTFTPPCYVNIKAKPGYSFTVFLSENGIITSSTGLITEYTMIPDQQYGVTLRTTDGTDDISETPVSSIIDIIYVSRVDNAIGDILSVSDRTNVLHNLIDYGYADKTVIAQPESSVPALHIGVSRKNTEVILDLSESQTNAMRVKVSGDILRAASNNAVDAWTSGLQTISGHKYRAMMLFESGTRTGDDKPIIVFYKTGEHSAIGNGQFDADKYIREWTSDGSSINIVIYIAPGITLTNAKYQIIFQDVTDEINIDDVDHTANSAYNKAISLDEKTNVLHDLVAYSNGDYKAVANPDSAYIYQHLGVSRIGSQIKLNLASEHTQTFCIKVSGGILRATSNNDINAWTSGLTLKNNHKYRVWAEYASGTIGGTGTNHPRIVVFNVGEHVSIGDVVTQGYSSYRDFVYTGTQVNVGLYVYANTTLTDATYQIYIQDITESFADMQIYNEVNRLGLHSMPETQGHLNVIKRARQYTEIRWTPAVDLPRCMYIDGKYWTGVFKGGVEYKGIPYGNPSQAMEDRYDKSLYVCFYVPFDTFVTAVSCKDSIIAKENVASISSHSSIAYAGICASLVSYAIGISLHSTTRLPNVSGMTVIGKINDDGTLLDESNFRLCDILNVVGLHTAIITDIIRDASGNITFIEVSEETPRGEQIIEAEGEQEGGVAIRRGYSLADFYTRWKDYSLLRYSNIASVTYTPSKYINVGGELEMTRYDRLPCLPYEGDKFTYKTGYIPNSAVKILIETHEFNKLRVFKDGTEISDSPFSVGENDKYINVTEISAGEYSAYLCNMSGETDTKFTTSCYWTIT